MALRMYILQICALFSLLWLTKAYPARPSDAVKKLLSRMGASQEHSDDYDEKMANIFDIPLNDDRRVNLENCQNIICMPHYLCIDDLVVTNGTELFELRISTRTNVGAKHEQLVCKHMEMPCCADAAITGMHVNHAIDNQNDQSQTLTDEIDYNDENAVEPNGPVVKKCGHRNKKNTSTRIIGGDEVQPNEFPWMVGVFYRMRSGDLRYIGGASLIHESVILTAAHLVERFTPDQLVIRAGEHDILDTKNDGKRQERNVTNIIVHEDLYVQSLINDIALIVVEKPFELSNAVNTVCLPPQSIQTDANVMCTSSGWGKNGVDRNGKYQATLKKVELPIVEQGKCENLFRRTRLGSYYNLDDSLMCAGGGYRDTCKGDGGSPLFCEIPHDKGRFYQTGIVAGGIGCGGKVPGLYVNVAHFSNWITQQFGYIDLHLEQQNVLQYQLFD